MDLSGADLREETVRTVKQLEAASNDAQLEILYKYLLDSIDCVEDGKSTITSGLWLKMAVAWKLAANKTASRSRVEIVAEFNYKVSQRLIDYVKRSERSEPQSEPRSEPQSECEQRETRSEAHSKCDERQSEAQNEKENAKTADVGLWLPE